MAKLLNTKERATRLELSRKALHGSNLFTGKGFLLGYGKNPDYDCFAFIVKDDQGNIHFCNTSTIMNMADVRLIKLAEEAGIELGSHTFLTKKEIYDGLRLVETKGSTDLYFKLDQPIPVEVGQYDLFCVYFKYEGRDYVEASEKSKEDFTANLIQGFSSLGAMDPKNNWISCAKLEEVMQ